MNTSTILWWDQGERIACETHAPPKGSDTRRTDRWRTITPEQAQQFEAEVGEPPACEACAAIACANGGA